MKMVDSHRINEYVYVDSISVDSVCFEPLEDIAVKNTLIGSIFCGDNLLFGFWEDHGLLRFGFEPSMGFISCHRTIFLWRGFFNRFNLEELYLRVTYRVELCQQFIDWRQEGF